MSQVILPPSPLLPLLTDLPLLSLQTTVGMGFPVSSVPHTRVTESPSNTATLSGSAATRPAPTVQDDNSLDYPCSILTIGTLCFYLANVLKYIHITHSTPREILTEHIEGEIARASTNKCDPIQLVVGGCESVGASVRLQY